MLIWTGTPRGVSLSGPPYVRPLSQGSNPWADIGCMAAIRIIADNLERAVTDPTHTEARPSNDVRRVARLHLLRKLRGPPVLERADVHGVSQDTY